MASDRVLAAPSGDCCLKVIQHKGDAKGRTETIYNIQTYISGAPNHDGKADRILFHFADVWGPYFINNQLVNDYFASQGIRLFRLCQSYSSPNRMASSCSWLL